MSLKSQTEITKNKNKTGWAWWLMPVIFQHFGRLRPADHLRPGVQDQSGQLGETLSLLKIQKSAEHAASSL